MTPIPDEHGAEARRSVARTAGAWGLSFLVAAAVVFPAGIVLAPPIVTSGWFPGVAPVLADAPPHVAQLVVGASITTLLALWIVVGLRLLGVTMKLPRRYFTGQRVVLLVLIALGALPVGWAIVAAAAGLLAWLVG